MNQAVKRNADRFPDDFMFQITAQEVADLKSQTVTSSSAGNRSQFVTGSQKHRDLRFLPNAFTEHGAIMVATVLNSPEQPKPPEPPQKKIGYHVRETRSKYRTKTNR